jgi:alkylated DNA nucleotide flippase Atl1
MERAIVEIPAGNWTTYGDLAALIGSHPVPVGQRVASVPVRNAHRVLQADGRVSPSFHWPDADRADDPVDVLRMEGIEFNDSIRADPAQRLSTEKLAALIGLDVDTLPEEVDDPAAGRRPELRDRFVQQLSESQSATVANATLTLITAWSELGGDVAYGRSAQTTCKLVTRTQSREQTWPLVIYPVDGQFEVSFKPMSSRPPFDDRSLRDEMRHRLNEIYGVDIDHDRLDRYPAIDLDMMVDVGAREQLIAVLRWFLKLVPA